MTEERDGDRRWNELPEDERQRYLKAFGCMLAIGASIYQARRRREAELHEIRRISKAADPMLAGIPTNNTTEQENTQ